MGDFTRTPSSTLRTMRVTMAMIALAALLAYATAAPLQNTQVAETEFAEAEVKGEHHMGGMYGGSYGGSYGGHGKPAAAQPGYGATKSYGGAYGGRSYVAAFRRFARSRLAARRLARHFARRFSARRFARRWVRGRFARRRSTR